VIFTKLSLLISAHDRVNYNLLTHMGSAIGVASYGTLGHVAPRLPTA